MFVAEFGTDSMPYVLSWIGTACWGVCFLWMWHISKKQNALLRELNEQTDRIERLSKAEHDLIKEVHPQVAEIKEHIEEVSETMRENSLANTHR